MKIFNFILLPILEPWVEYTHNFLEIFCATSFCRKRALLIASVVAPSGFGVRS